MGLIGYSRKKKVRSRFYVLYNYFHALYCFLYSQYKQFFFRLLCRTIYRTSSNMSFLNWKLSRCARGRYFLNYFHFYILILNWKFWMKFLQNRGLPFLHCKWNNVDCYIFLDTIFFFQVKQKYFFSFNSWFLRSSLGQRSMSFKVKWQ